MKTKKINGIFNLIIAGLLFAIIFLSSIYEVMAFSNYVDSLPSELKGEAFGILAVIIIMIFSVPFSVLLGILTLISGIKVVQNKEDKKSVVMGITCKFIVAAGLIALAIIYICLYAQGGWLSKIVYLFTAVAALGTAIYDLCLISPKKASVDGDEEYDPFPTENESETVETDENLDE